VAEDFDHFHVFDAFDFRGKEADFVCELEFEFSLRFGEIVDFFNKFGVFNAVGRAGVRVWFWHWMRLRQRRATEEVAFLHSMCENGTCLIFKKYRVMTIYTGAGDEGKTKLLGLRKFKKNSKIVHALGEIDELSTFIGFAACKCDRSTEMGMSFLGVLDKIQEDLYKIGAELAGADLSRMGVGDVEWAENMIDKYWGKIASGSGAHSSVSNGNKIGKFVKPGERGELSARLHVCRAVCRRTERFLYSLWVIRRFKYIRQYINRLSDLLFVMSEC